jgi:EAL domain-containing protein (putative c-di-GMP-specific phosphodiesterase class I)
VELGCEQGKGFLMARPLDGSAVESLITQYLGTVAVS